MGQSLLQRFLEHYDPIHRGWTPAGIANGVCAMNGFSFPRVAGGYNLRRAVGVVPDEGCLIVGSAGFDADEVKTFPWVSHEPDCQYVYRLTSISGGGVENVVEPVTAEVSTDEVGGWCGAFPNSPVDVRVCAVAGGCFEIRWRYLSRNEQVSPHAFRVYCDQGSRVIDYVDSVDEVPYVIGRRDYVWRSDSFSHDTRVSWCVRAVSAAGVEDDSSQVVSARSVAYAVRKTPATMIELV